MWRNLQRYLSGLISATLDDVTGGTDATDYAIYNRTCDATINLYRGIVIGTGTSETGINSTRLDSLVQLGTGSGQVVGLDSTSEFDFSTGIATVTRSFLSQNASSGTLIIGEVGLCSNQETRSDGIMIVRDKLVSTVSVSYEDIISVQYKIRISQGNNNYTNLLIRPLGSDAVTNFVNTTGSVINPSPTASPGLIAPEGTISYGIVFGTSNTAFSKTQIDLQSKIFHGNSAGQLFYHPVTNTVIEENATTNSLSFKFTRAVEYRSGSDVYSAQNRGR
jgi:hypothetical protein